MAFIKRKTRKKIVKQLRKLVNRHGPDVVSDFASSLMAEFAARFLTRGDGDGKGRRARRSD